MFVENVLMCLLYVGIAFKPLTKKSQFIIFIIIFYKTIIVLLVANVGMCLLYVGSLFKSLTKKPQFMGI